MIEIKAKLEIGSQRQDEFSFNGGNMPIKNSQRSSKGGKTLKVSSQSSNKKAAVVSDELDNVMPGILVKKQ